MSDDQSASAKPERSERQMEIQRLAKERAEKQGRSWKEMSVDERKSIKKSIAAELRKSGDTERSD